MSVARAGAVAVALLVDALAGEPPARVHPVVGMGRLLAVAARVVPTGPPARAAVAGGLAWAGALAVVTTAAVGLGRATARSPLAPRVLVEGAALSTLLSARLLLRETAAVEDALSWSPDAGREAVSRVVSRDTSRLGASQVRAAALGSLSENLGDSVVAPVLAYAVGGLPAAAAYRFVNTADAMWGYRSARWRHAGTVAARVDDVANLVPARLAGVLVAWLPGPGDRPAPGALVREARRTPSPNGGWPMGALALRLGVRLEKPGVYALHPAGRAPAADDTAAALAVVRRCVVAAGVLAAGLAWAVGRGDAA